MRRRLIRRVYRTGVQTVEVDEHGRYYLTIRNRTYASEHEVPRASALRYYERMRGTGA